MRKPYLTTVLTSAALMVSTLVQPPPVSADADVNLTSQPTTAEADQFCGQPGVAAAFGETAFGMVGSHGVVTDFGLTDRDWGFYCFFTNLDAGVNVFPNSSFVDFYKHRQYTTEQNLGAATIYWDSYYEKIVLVCADRMIQVSGLGERTLQIAGVTIVVPASKTPSEAEEVDLLNKAADVWCSGDVAAAAPSRKISFARTMDDLRRLSDYDLGDASALRLYRAFFNREPEFGGAKYWLTQRRSGVGMVAIAAVFADSEEFRLTYGETTDAEFLRIVYSNVLGRHYDQGGYDYWLNLLDGGLSRAEMVMYFAVGEEFSASYPYSPLE